METQHTPVAHYRLIEYEGNEWFHVFDDNTGQLVGKFQRRDQAEKFVRAANSYDEDQKKIAALLEAAKDALAELYRVSPSFAAPKLRNAIARAEV